MPRGGPDYKLWGQPTARFPLYDLGELAARLGSADTMDRRGELVAATAFTPGDWLGGCAVSGADSKPWLSRYFALSHGYSLMLRSGATAGDYAMWYIGLGVPVRYRVGLETVLMLYGPQTVTRLSLAVYKGGRLYQAQVRYQAAAKIWEYLNGANAWTATGIDAPLYVATYVWHQVKLVLDLELAEYGYLLVNGEQFSLAGYDIYDSATSVPDTISFGVIVDGYAGGDSAALLDRAIITQAEPAE